MNYKRENNKILIYKTIDSNSIIYNIGVLIDKIITSKNEKIFIYCQNADIMNIIDDKLWTFSPNYFIPHAIYTNENKVDFDNFVLLSIDNLKDNLVDQCNNIILYGDHFFIDYILSKNTKLYNNKNIILVINFDIDCNLIKNDYNINDIIFYEQDSTKKWIIKNI